MVLTSNTVTIGASGSSTINKIDDSAQDIQYETKNDVINEAYAGTKQSTEVAVSQGAQFSVMIPKKIVLDGSTGSADFAVKVTGDIPGNQKITVAPESETVVLATKGKKDISAGIVQKKTEWSVAEDTQDGLAAGVEEIGYISTKDLSAGTWTGTFNFNIAVEEIAAA